MMTPLRLVTILMAAAPLEKYSPVNGITSHDGMTLTAWLYTVPSTEQEKILQSSAEKAKSLMVDPCPAIVITLFGFPDKTDRPADRQTDKH